MNVYDGMNAAEFSKYVKKKKATRKLYSSVPGPGIKTICSERSTGMHFLTFVFAGIIWYNCAWNEKSCFTELCTVIY